MLYFEYVQNFMKILVSAHVPVACINISPSQEKILYETLSTNVNQREVG